MTEAKGVIWPDDECYGCGRELQPGERKLCAECASGDTPLRLIGERHLPDAARLVPDGFTESLGLHGG